ncbi:hypothetical protein HELRODRAFT_102529 [Helobdella robusta]|uniref:Selenocysteine-specific elongation factor n=1 Tax=Helobdella robusta TaxID=6412 RepID=T1EDA0_HELRO|nr:hypothetical protein HELRODRAFT_102529 [Helobdella robusta]ESN95480.1 hypothetical protein HELRODRAFT_102529 [Helobdella robusta]
MSTTPAKTLNFNVGVLGHVDSGKTSLAKALSTVASTACFDKNPQSKERGITLDLGFSSFAVDAPSHVVEAGYEKLQFTLVDCPGHASLIKTIIGGAQIVDMMMLVVDITKGMQTQTAECLVIGEITCRKMIVVLNKIDLIPDDKRDATIEKMKKKMWKTLERTKFSTCAICPVAAKPGGAESGDSSSISVEDLIETLKSTSYIPTRCSTGPLLFSIDHCFLIKGQGTVMTGTMLSGSIAVNDTVEISSLKITKKVKSIQMFKSNVNKAIQGDRIGICQITYYVTPHHVASNIWHHVTGDLGTPPTYALVELDHPLTCDANFLVITSKLDTDIHSNTCRLAFHGRIVNIFNMADGSGSGLSALKVYKTKSRDGVIERKVDECTVICKNLFKKETNLDVFSGLKVRLSTGEDGYIEGSFGQSGKVKIRIPAGLKDSTSKLLAAKSSSKKSSSKSSANQSESAENLLANQIKDCNLDTTQDGSRQIKVTLEFKRYIFDSSHKIVQS